MTQRQFDDLMRDPARVKRAHARVMATRLPPDVGELVQRALDHADDESVYSEAFQRLAPKLDGLTPVQTVKVYEMLGVHGMDKLEFTKAAHGLTAHHMLRLFNVPAGVAGVGARPQPCPELLALYDDDEPTKTQLFNADPNCQHEIVQLWSGIKCKHCSGWFCW